jgi:hypothetical protein
MNDFFDSIVFFFDVLSFLSIPFLFLWLAYKLLVQKKEWWEILGHAQSDQGEDD